MSPTSVMLTLLPLRDQILVPKSKTCVKWNIWQFSSRHFSMSGLKRKRVDRVALFSLPCLQDAVLDIFWRLKYAVTNFQYILVSEMYVDWKRLIKCFELILWSLFCVALPIAPWTHPLFYRVEGSKCVGRRGTGVAHKVSLGEAEYGECIVTLNARYVFTHFL